MGMPATVAADPLDPKADEGRVDLHKTGVVPKPDQTSFLTTGAFDHV